MRYLRIFARSFYDTVTDWPRMACWVAAGAALGAVWAVAR